MIDRSRIRLLTGAVASALLPGLWSCAGPPPEGPPPPLYPPYYYDYYYYPYWGVYFHIYTGWYYYHDHGRWRRVRRLPPHIRLDRRHRRLLHIRESEPWRRHGEHRRQYPPPPKPRLRPRPEPPPQPQPRPRPQPRPERPEPLPQPEDQPERQRDREEREHNIRRHEEYRKRSWPPPAN